MIRPPFTIEFIGCDDERRYFHTLAASISSWSESLMDSDDVDEDDDDDPEDVGQEDEDDAEAIVTELTLRFNLNGKAYKEYSKEMLEFGYFIIQINYFDPETVDLLYYHQFTSHGTDAVLIQSDGSLQSSEVELILDCTEVARFVSDEPAQVTLN